MFGSIFWGSSNLRPQWKQKKTTGFLDLHSSACWTWNTMHKTTSHIVGHNGSKKVFLVLWIFLFIYSSPLWKSVSHAKTGLKGLHKKTFTLNKLRKLIRTFDPRPNSWKLPDFTCNVLYAYCKARYCFFLKYILFLLFLFLLPFFHLVSFNTSSKELSVMDKYSCWTSFGRKSLPCRLHVQIISSPHFSNGQWHFDLFDLLHGTAAIMTSLDVSWSTVTRGINTETLKLHFRIFTDCQMKYQHD